MDKRYLIFEIMRYYPHGGIADKVASFDSLEDSVAYIYKQRDDNNIYGLSFQVYDRIEGKEVEFE